mmetsp:Transcript_40030/g.74608  ORF Transcript_40030/g.74608 Transcript_40030/m.74608 type:complete len:100 (-) Transcript_40030:220-519(-)
MEAGKTYSLLPLTAPGEPTSISVRLVSDGTATKHYHSVMMKETHGTFIFDRDAKRVTIQWETKAGVKTEVWKWNGVFGDALQLENDADTAFVLKVSQVD